MAPSCPTRYEVCRRTPLLLYARYERSGSGTAARRAASISITATLSTSGETGGWPAIGIVPCFLRTIPVLAYPDVDGADLDAVAHHRRLLESDTRNDPPRHKKKRTSGPKPQRKEMKESGAVLASATQDGWAGRGLKACRARAGLEQRALSRPATHTHARTHAHVPSEAERGSVPQIHETLILITLSSGRQAVKPTMKRRCGRYSTPTIIAGALAAGCVCTIELFSSSLHPRHLRPQHIPRLKNDYLAHMASAEQQHGNNKAS